MKTHYYLINNSIMKGGEMPKESTVREHFGLIIPKGYSEWSLSLQPCYISDSELEKVKNQLWHNFDNDKIFIERSIINSPIEVTDIIEAYSSCCGQCDGIEDECNGREMYRFKSTNKYNETNEAIDFTDWILDNTAFKLGSKLRSYYVNGLLHGNYTTTELYKIFKQIKK